MGAQKYEWGPLCGFRQILSCPCSQGQAETATGERTATEETELDNWWGCHRAGTICVLTSWKGESWLTTSSIQ